MSSIPPTWLASIIQTQGSQARSTEAHSKERAGAPERGGDKFSSELGEVIENDDRDSEVYSDAEGSGSEGKTYSEADEDEAAEIDPSNEQVGQDGHLDIQG